MRRITSTTIAIALALTFGVATRASAQACTATGPNAGPFSIDGCITSASNSKLAGDATAVVDPNGNTKELGPINGSATKLGNINSAPTPMLGLTNPNASVDLNTVYTQTAPDAFGDIWFYFGWKRDSNNGSGFVSIELQKTGVPLACTGVDGYGGPLCNPWVGRQTGDVLILWDQQGGSTAISIRLYNSALQAFGPAVLLNPANGDVKARYSPDLTSGEAAINFSNVIFPTDGSCQSFANTIPGTVTGNSDTADYKDAVLSAFPPVSNCGVVKITKVTQPAGLAGPAGGFIYTLARAGGENVKFGGPTSITDNLPGHGDSDSFTDILIGNNFTLTEATQVAPWAYVSTSCVLHAPDGDVSAGPATGFTVVGGVTTECTITNKREQGTITVIKHVINDNGGSAVAGDFTMSLGAGNPTFSGTEAGVTTTLNAGTAFAVTESSVAGYTGTIGTGAGDTCSGTMVAGAAYTCTVTNDDNAAHLIIIKVVTNDNGLTKVAGDFSGTITGVTAVGGNTWVGTASPGVNKTLSTVGTFGVTETAAAGYTTTYSGCTGTIALGETKTCTVTNNDNPASPTGTTSQKVLLHDSISIPGIRDGAGNKANATATFRLYTNDTCTTPVLVGGNAYSEAVTLSYGSIVNGVTSGSAATSVGVTVLQPKTATTFYWRVEYSGDSFNSTFTTGCGIETTTLAIQ